MPGFRLRLFGGFRLEGADGGEIAIASRKAQGLIAVLALHSPAAVTRERAAAMLWQDQEDDRARHNLRQALTALRRDAAIVVASGDTLALDTGVCAVDVLEFRSLAASADRESLERAMDLYTGPLLQGVAAQDGAFDEWLGVERTHLEKSALDAMGRLAAQHSARADHEAAARVLNTLLRRDPANEDAHRGLMRALEGAGRRSDALHQYQACRELLLKHLGLEPGAATRALYESLRSAGAGEQGTETQGMRVVAILPFSNFARTPVLEALASTIVEDMGGQLSRVPGFSVVAQPAVVAAMQSSPGDLGHLSRTLRASYLVTGSLRQPEPGRVRVATQVVDGGSLQYLWSQQQDFAETAALASIDDIVSATCARIEQQLTLAEGKAGGRQGVAQDAWNTMHRASSALFSAGWSEEAVQSSIRLYREAIALDPDLALARAQKALVMALARRWGLLEDAAAEAEARADAERALELEPTRSEVLGCAGCALADLGDPERAVPLLERAIEENPSNAQAWAALGATRLLQKQYEAGVESLRRGLRTSPTDYRRSVWLTALCGGLVRLERLDEALDAAQGACRSDSKFYPARVVLAMVLARLGRDAEASRALAEAKRIRPRLSPAEIRLWAGRALDRLAGLPAR
jgi:DNA-binding SARP family transcriptional activator